MQTPHKAKWDDFDHRVSGALAARSRSIRLPDGMWQRILYRVVESGRESENKTSEKSRTSDRRGRLEG